MRPVALTAALLMAVSRLAAAEPVASDPAGDPAWAEYDRAFVLLAEGKPAVARVLLDQLVRRWPDHPAASRAAERLAEIEPKPTVVTNAPSATPPPPVEGGPSSSARGELILWMTISGIQLGATACIDRCVSDREYAGTLMAAGGGALALSVLATRSGIRHGEAQLYNSAMSWGSWNALGINDGFPEDSREAGVSIGGQLAGLSAGVGLWQLWRPTQGDVALTNTVFAWTTILTLFGHLAVEAEPTLRSMVVVGDVALLAGALLSTQAKMSRGRTFMIDVGGILGALVGGVLAVAMDDESGAGAALLLGSGAGLAIGTAATKRWDEDDDPDRNARNLRITPTSVGARGWGGAVALDF